jgi:hypothetical protein
MAVGRPGHAVVDALGLLPALVTDAHHVLELVWADGGYIGSLMWTT